jgi:hypothetical protein
MSERVIAYIDGFNFYFGLKAAKYKRYFWLDLQHLMQSILKPFWSQRICPECLHEFNGNGWDGIDAHWRAKHEKVMPYEQFWGNLCENHR